MPRRPSRTAPTVILHGWQGSTGEHWQAWLAEQLRSAEREVRFPELPEAESPRLSDWLAGLEKTLAGLPDDGFDVVAHSLGAILWLHHAARSHASPRPARVALVAPVSPRTAIAQLQDFFPVPLDIDTVRRAADGTALIGSDDDPYTPEGIAEAYGRPLKMPTTIVKAGGHINVEAGYGPWPAMLAWCGRDNLAFL
ncbi:MAG: alpha/beta hydrolase [Actinomycetota bacterium]|nr:alpha/beta hydrolase [Actinomycetota bacterium]